MSLPAADSVVPPGMSPTAAPAEPVVSGTGGIRDYKLLPGLVSLELAPGASVRTAKGAMVAKQPEIEMVLSTGGGLGPALARKIAGESFFLPEFRNRSQEPRWIFLGIPYPGRILPLDLAVHGSTVLAQKHTLLCADATVRIATAFREKAATGLVDPDAEGFLLQSFSGSGTVFLYGGGDLIQLRLAEGEALDVDLGSLVAFGSTVRYNVRSVGGLAQAALGGEGMWLCDLRGPGYVYIQSLPFIRLSQAVQATNQKVAARR